MLFWQEEKSCQAITCFVKHARACLSVFQPNTTENFWGRWWGRWAGKLAWQNLVINCEWNFCTWVSSLHLLTGDLDTTSEPNFVECYLAWILMVTEMGCWAKIQVQSVKSLIKHIERPEFLQIERIGTMELAQIGPSWNCPYLSMECIPFWFPVPRKPAWQKSPWHRRHCKGGWVDHELGVTAHMISENLTPATLHG